MSQQIMKPRTFKDMIQAEPVKARLKEILGERGNQFAVALQQIVNGSYQLQKCEPASILGAALTAAALDLSCDPNLGEAHLVPYKDKCQFQIGYRGFIQLAMRSGQYKAIGSAPVYEGELVSYDRLTGELVLDSKLRTSDLVIGYAAKFKLINGFERAEYWTAEEIEAHASRYSKAYRYAKGNKDKEDNCLWCTDRDKMALKTVEKALLSHYGPKSIQMQKAIKVDGGAVIDADTGEVEYLDNDDKKLASPDFGEPTKAAEVEVLPPEKASTKVEGGQASAINKVKAILGFLKMEGLTEKDMVAFLNDCGATEGNKALADAPQNVIDMVYDQHADMIRRIKEAKKS
jgi:recombination protein RecT